LIKNHSIVRKINRQ